MKKIFKELSTSLYETNIRLTNLGLMYNYIINKLKELANEGKLGHQAQNAEWTRNYKEK
jgi:hypothetical protein